jgi:tetratricopeptide (TPR) repeat protein
VIKHFGLKLKQTSTLAVALLVAFALAHPSSLAHAQAQASVHGHVNNAIGQAVTKGDVKLTTDRTSEPKGRKYQYTFPIDQNGDFKGSGIAPATYLAVVFVDDKTVDFQDVTLAAGDDKVVNFDMTRKEYIDKMTPEERKNLEEFKKKNEAAVKANEKITNLNKELVQARADTKAGNYDAAITGMQNATTAKPDEPILWIALGDAQLGAANAAATAAKKAGTPANTPDIEKKFTDAATSYKKGIDLNAASKKPNPQTAAAAYNQLGQALSKGGDSAGAANAYDQAAKADPTHAGMYYFNEAATFYNSGKLDEAGAAADKAIAADPNRADAYYIKGQALIPKATVDPKTQKIVAPPGCVEAYQKYLELAPNGPHAADIEGILTGIGAKVKSSYKAGKK